jgi:hypothetical protein
MSVNQMYVNQISVNQMSAVIMSVGQMLVRLKDMEPIWSSCQLKGFCSATIVEGKEH